MCSVYARVDRLQQCNLCHFYALVLLATLGRSLKELFISLCLILFSVDLSVQPSFILIGNSGTFSCNFKDIFNWQKIEIKRRSFDNNSVVVVSTDNLIDSYDTKVSRTTIRVTKSLFTHNSGQVQVVIDSIQCSDVFGVPGDVTYECSVHYDDTFVAFDRKLITIQGEFILKLFFYVSCCFFTPLPFTLFNTLPFTLFILTVHRFHRYFSTHSSFPFTLFYFFYHPIYLFQ